MTGLNRRYSKAALIEYLDRRVGQLQSEHGFHPTDGSAQVNGRGEEVNRAYGEHEALNGLLLNVRCSWRL